jgi:hypothetical protein
MLMEMLQCSYDGLVQGLTAVGCKPYRAQRLRDSHDTQRL